MPGQRVKPGPTYIGPPAPSNDHLDINYSLTPMVFWDMDHVTRRPKIEKPNTAATTFRPSLADGNRTLEAH
ncbi:hypothetical protein NL676_025101 [Syzygium grande]|nr:hypothetical protein NL676_025101 [Syzygium grande]